ncbi:Qat anti-phage system QueC-like protein QatC [Brevundimonas diminuta]|uniref:Qat anti-phage system QueC-like protein QatC n=1 Tax=Brevundimonas diminuta TaxID=293 RepID=UPI000B36408C|nr:Qat anti-phage system QueC-like protein QatC [Brevundimonas diminuta]
MSRHLLVGRFGADDKIAVPNARDENVSMLQLVTGKRIDYGISRTFDDLRSLELRPSELGADLLVVAAHVHAADTRISRASESQDGWTRQIRLVIPVSDPARWEAASGILKRALDFLTGDRWEIGFRARPKGFEDIVPPMDASLIPPPFDGVSLFSGGLDSLIGAIDTLETKGSPLLVSHAGEGLVSKSQELCFDGLKAAYPKASFDRLRMWMAFGQGLVEDVASEETTRGRSFLFFSIGIAAGTALGKPFILKVPENGLIALNVPLDPLRLGALSTRTTHPFYMARWNELLGALGIPASVDNPYWDKTKGEMVRSCAGAATLKKLAPASLSCSSPSKGRWSKKPQGHCGYCLPCLIRRASLPKTDTTTYGVPDLKAKPLNTKTAEGVQVRSFQLAIERLEARPDLAKLLIHKPGPLTDDPSRLDGHAGVYRRGLAEVGELLRGVKTVPG